MKPIEQHILNQKKPYQSIMLYVRSVIFKALPNIEERCSYKIPFYFHNKKPMCYLNILKNTNYVDVAFVQGAFLQDKYPQLKGDNNRKQVRSLHLNKIEDLDELMFVQLLIEASKLLNKSKKAWNP